MEKRILTVDEKRGIVQVTIADERWYMKEGKDEEGIPKIEAVPSSTWITHYYYTSPYLIKWIADKGIDESERLKKEAGEKGSRVHKAVEMWLQGEEIKINTTLPNRDGELAELTAEENEAFKSFIDFYTEHKPKIIGSEYVVWGNGYAGTVDLKVEMNGELGILDIKTSKAIYSGHELQVSSYKHADPDCEKITKLWILQLGYSRNKNKYKLTEIEDKFNLFLNAMDTWRNEVGHQVPKYIEYPIKYPTKQQIDTAQPEPKGEAEIKNGKVKRNTKTSEHTPEVAVGN